MAGKERTYVHLTHLSRRTLGLALALAAFVAAPVQAQTPGADAPVQPPPPGALTNPDPAQVQGTDPSAPAAEPPKNAALLDGHVREGAFLSGTGSLTFVLHHTLMAAAAGFATQGVSTHFNLALEGRERMLAGTLIGAGLGFGISAWWQFNHWIGLPMANYGIVNSVASGLFLLGLMDLLTDNGEALAWSAFVGMELGAWLTATLGGGDMRTQHGLLIASGGLWGLIYSALLVGLLNGSGTQMSGERIFDTMAIMTGVGAGALALATINYSPTTAQVLRADVFGLGVGAGVFVLSALVVGFDLNNSLPYVLAGVSSAGAIAAVSLLWEEAAERPEDKALGTNIYYRSPEKDRPYSNVWW